MALLHGAELVIPMKEQIQDLDKFEDLIKSKKVTVATLPPVYYAKVSNLDLRVLITAGSEANQEIVRKARQRYINAYGPTENTICATHWEYLQGDKIPINIPIGKPIQNVQIYILKGDKLCSIGVPGELCIAGISLARGYLNMPEMTKKKFVSNPFGKGRLYRSGDLARWLEDGNLEFLGRIDEQVKISGYRIELGEIEYIIRKFDGIRDTAVIVTHDKLGDKMLCAYIVSDDKINIDILRKFLSEKLPSYMLPTFIVQIDCIPLSLNGKLDKKVLPDFENMTTGNYVKPRNELEASLCVVVQEVTGQHEIGIKENIFELGVNSIKAISIVGRVKKLGIDLPIQKIFELTTIESLANYIEEKEPLLENVKQSYVEIDKLLSLNRVDESIKINKRSLKNIVLTGVTGFLGIHILAELIEKHSGKIYCIIRSKDEEDAYNRLKECLSYYYGEQFNNLIKDKVFVISSSIEQKDLIEKLPVDISTVIHAAAITKHYGFKADFENVNVQGTQNLLDYAKNIGARFVYISTTSVAGEIQKDSKDIEYNETNYYIGQTLSASEYTKSKFKAERLVLDSKLKGNDTIIIRVGNLTNRWSDGIAAQNYRENRFINMIKLLVDKGYVAQDLLKYELQFSAVDIVARGVIALTEISNINFSMYHLFQVKKVRLEQLVRIFDKLGVKMPVIDKETDIREEFTYSSVTESSFELISDESTNNDYIYPVAKCDFTNWLLEKSGFIWEEPDEAYLYKVIQYFLNNGFWKR
jgi:thioester reductase-like protein